MKHLAIICTMNKTKKYLNLLVVLFITINSNLTNAQAKVVAIKGTTVISIARDDTIWIGADSKVTNLTNDIRYDCKLKITDSIIFTYTGSYWYITDLININTDSIFYHCIKNKNTSVDNIIKRFNDTIITALEKIGLDLMQRNKYKVNDTIDNELNAIFSFNRRNVPHMMVNAYRTIVVDTNLNAKKPLKICTEQEWMIANDEKTKCRLYGKIEAIIPEIISIKPQLNKIYIPKLINEMINAESKAQPQEVGGNINIVCITPRGIRWIQKMQPCY